MFHPGSIKTMPHCYLSMEISFKVQRQASRLGLLLGQKEIIFVTQMNFCALFSSESGLNKWVLWDCTLVLLKISYAKSCLKGSKYVPIFICCKITNVHKKQQTISQFSLKHNMPLAQGAPNW